MYQSEEIEIGNIKVGGSSSIVVQSMISTKLLDTQGCIRQIIQLHESGCEMVRFSIVSKKEIPSLQIIKTTLRKMGCNIPLIADIHFNSSLAGSIAPIVEKVRINPGNFTGNSKKEWTKEAIVKEKSKIKQEFSKLLDICIKEQTAIRIGVNHGSLSDRILSVYGNTPEGMVASALEYCKIAQEKKFNNLVISIKSSSPIVMIASNRLLAHRLKKEKMKFPIHLGVTEAGNNIEGRIKSIIGIGSLLQDQIGDTIRISLTEHPCNEIPVAKKLLQHIQTHSAGKKPVLGTKGPFKIIGSISDLGGTEQKHYDYVYSDTPMPNEKNFMLPYSIWNKLDEKIKPFYFPVLDQGDLSKIGLHQSMSGFILIRNTNFNFEELNAVSKSNLLFCVVEGNQVEDIIEKLNTNCNVPILLKHHFISTDKEELLIDVTLKVAPYLINNTIEGIWLSYNYKDKNYCNQLTLDLLQCTEKRRYRTDFVACPSCGRTQFELEKITNQIKARTNHLKGLKIGIMGCVINGLGEMAGADYGYVGADNGKINLYKKQQLVKKSVLQMEAVDELIALIKTNGDWKEPEPQTIMAYE